MGFPHKQGLYDPANEHDSCGVGFVANIKGRKSHEVIQCGLQILVNLDHRGAVGADPLVGDGAGCLIQIPHGLLAAWAKDEGVDLPPAGEYAVAMCFLPRDVAAREMAMSQLEHFLLVEKQPLIGWRDVPHRHHRPGRSGAGADAGDPPGDHRPRSQHSRPGRP